LNYKNHLPVTLGINSVFTETLPRCTSVTNECSKILGSAHTLDNNELALRTGPTRAALRLVWSRVQCQMRALTDL